MASNRHLGRIVVLQTLYEFDFRVECEDSTAVVDDIMQRNVSRYSETIEDKNFISSLVKGVEKDMNSLDDIIRPIAPEWPIEQIARIDRNILRMSLWELLNSADVPPKVVINEAVELAKAFGGDNSSKFVNGVLGTAYRNMQEDNSAAAEQEATTKAPKKPKASSATKKSTSKKSKKVKDASKKAAEITEERAD